MQKASVCRFLFKINIKKMIDQEMIYHFYAHSACAHPVRKSFKPEIFDWRSVIKD
jgi:hypothetical protein